LSTEKVVPRGPAAATRIPADFSVDMQQADISARGIRIDVTPDRIGLNGTSRGSQFDIPNYILCGYVAAGGVQ
jgi:hypothetical protein